MIAVEGDEDQELDKGGACEVFKAKAEALENKDGILPMSWARIITINHVTLGASIGKGS